VNIKPKRNQRRLHKIHYNNENQIHNNNNHSPNDSDNE